MCTVKTRGRSTNSLNPHPERSAYIYLLVPPLPTKTLLVTATVTDNAYIFGLGCPLLEHDLAQHFVAPGRIKLLSTLS